MIASTFKCTKSSISQYNKFINLKIGEITPKSCVGRYSKITNENKSLIEDYSIINPALLDSDLQKNYVIQNQINIR